MLHRDGGTGTPKLPRLGGKRQEQEMSQVCHKQTIDMRRLLRFCVPYICMRSQATLITSRGPRRKNRIGHKYTPDEVVCFTRNHDSLGSEPRPSHGNLSALPFRRLQYSSHMIAHIVWGRMDARDVPSGPLLLTICFFLVPPRANAYEGSRVAGLETLALRIQRIEGLFCVKASRARS